MSKSSLRREVSILLGVSLLCLLPIAVVIRLRQAQQEIKPTPQPVKVRAPTTPIGPIALSPHGKLLAGIIPWSGAPVNGQQYGILILWDIVKQRELRRWRINHESALALRWSPDSRVIQNSGRWVERWDAATGRKVSRPLHIDFKKGAFRSHGEDLLFLGSTATFAGNMEVNREGMGHVRVIDAVTGKPRGEWNGGWGQDFFNRSLQISPAPPVRVSYRVQSKKKGEADAHLQTWDVQTRRRLWEIRVPSVFPSSSFSEDGHLLVVWGLSKKSQPASGSKTQQPPMNSSCVAWVLDAATGKKLREFETNDVRTDAVSFGTSGNLFASAGADWQTVDGKRQEVTTIRIHRADTGKMIDSFHLPPQYNALYNLDLSRDGTLIAASDFSGVRIWKLSALRNLSLLPPPPLAPAPTARPNSSTGDMVAPGNPGFPTRKASTSPTSSPASSGRSRAPESRHPAPPARP